MKDINISFSDDQPRNDPAVDIRTTFPLARYATYY